MATFKSSPEAPPAATPSRLVPRLYLACFLASLAVPFIPHMCNDLHAKFLVITLPSAALAWYLAVVHTPKRLIERIGPYLVVVFSSVIAALNVIQGCFTGCSPLFR